MFSQSYIPWQLLIIFSGILSGFSQFVRKHQVHRLGVFQLGFWKDLGSLLAIVPFFIILREPISITEIDLLTTSMGMLSAIGTGAYYVAMRHSLSGTAVFTYTAGQICLLLGSFVFFNELRYFNPGSLQGLTNIAAIVIFFASMWLYSGGASASRWNRMIWLNICINLIINLVAKYVIGEGYSAVRTTFNSYLGSLIGSMLFAKVRSQSLAINERDTWIGLGQGAIGGLAVLLYFQALAFAPLSLASMFRRIAIMVFTLGAGMYFFGERKGKPREIAGLTLGVALFGLITWANQ